MDEEPRAELQRHLTEVVPSAGGAVTGGLVGVVLGGAAGALAGATAGAVLEHVTREALRRRWERGEQALEIAATTANLTPEQLLERILRDERLLELSAAVIATAAETTLQAKIRALGRALARGATDEAVIDAERFMVGVLAALEAPHVRVLGQMAYRCEGYGEERNPDGDPQAHGWTLEALTEHLAGLSAVLHPVLEILSANGLIRDTAVGTYDYNPRWVVTEAGETVLRMLGEMGTEDARSV